jgi:Ca2+/Na+ antiporter
LGAALNSPELFSNIVGIFVLKDPVGLGLVMGSFNFNILCITGFTAIISRKRLRSRQLKLEWRYLQRDAGLYLAAVLLLIYVASDQLLEAWECFAMLALYVLYIVLCMMTGYIARMCCTPTRKPRRKRPLGRIICEVMGEEWVKSLLEQQPPSRSSTDHDPGTNISEPYQPPTEAVMSAANGDRRAPAAADTACNFPSVKAIRTESSPVFFSQLGSGQQTSATASPSAPGTPVWSQDGEVKATELRKVMLAV